MQGGNRLTRCDLYLIGRQTLSATRLVLTSSSLLQPPLRKLQTQQAQLEEDRTKFITYIHSAAAKQEKLDGVIVQLVEKLKDSSE